MTPADHALTLPAPGAHPDGWARWPEAVDAFTADLARKGYSIHTLRDYRGDVVRLGGALGVTPTALRPHHLRQMDRLNLRQGMSREARRRRRSAYHRFLEFLADRGESAGIAPRVLHAAAASHILDRLLPALVYLSGLRLTEIAHLEGRDIRIRKGLITTRLGYRMIPMHPALKEMIFHLRHHAPLAAYRPVIPGLNGFAPNTRTLHSRFQRLMTALGFGGLKPETLRREVSSTLLFEGTPPGLVRAFLGKDRGRPLAPRRGRFVDLSCLAERIAAIPA